MGHIMLALPTYLGRIEDTGVLWGMLKASKNHEVTRGTHSTSANCLAMNTLWLQAQEARKTLGVTHFAMMHSDIAPEDWWLDKLMEIMKRENADIVSTVIPIKDEKGLTSTALDEPVGDFPLRWRVRRLTMREIHQMPPTFTAPNLLTNDGLMLVDLSKNWIERVHFHFDDDIIEYHGKRVVVCAPEDWNFARDARALGATIYATREVRARHIGATQYPNEIPWGSWETDTLCQTGRRRDPDIQKAVDAAINVRGYMTPDELAWLAEQARGKETVIEIGSWLGRSTKAMAMTVGGQVIAVDHWRGTGNGDATGEEAKEIDPWAEFCHNVGHELNRRKIQTIMMAHEALDMPLTYHDGLTMDVVLVEPADMLFIDGGHEYEDVARDIKNCIGKVKPGGVLCGHDYTPTHPGVIKAVNELVPGFKVAPGTSIWWATVGPQMAPGSNKQLTNEVGGALA